MDLRFSSRTEILLRRAEAMCDERGAKLTDLRRQVLGLILDAEAPAGAYDLLARLRETRGSAAPPTVYRALDFLLEHGLIHRLERLAAFIGCVTHEAGADHSHAAQFLICRDCKRATEIEDAAITEALTRASRARGFAAQGATVEVIGSCAECAAAKRVPFNAHDAA